jgi:hypothetical protein
LGGGYRRKAGFTLSCCTLEMLLEIQKHYPPPHPLDRAEIVEEIYVLFQFQI